MQVIVDLRDLRSQLPNMLDAAGFQVDARTLEVGDYILSNEICVERKSVQDFYQSAKSGRLLKQVTQMSRHYARPCVLLEFPEAGPFGLFDLPGQTDRGGIGYVAQLVLLAVNYPNISLIWSKSPRATVDLFKEVRESKTHLPYTQSSLTSSHIHEYVYLKAST